MIVCVCRNINEEYVKKAIKDGATCVKDINSCVKCPVTCGKCGPYIKQMIKEEK